MMSPFVGEHSRHAGYEFCSLTGKLLPGFIVLVFIVSYCLPNALEFLLIRHGAPAVALVIIGDLTGCAILGVVLNIRWALGIYVAMSDRKSTRLNSSHLGISYA